MAWRWVAEERACPLRGVQFHLGVRAREATENGDRAQTIVWRGPSPKAARIWRDRKCWCYARRRCFGIGWILSATRADRWLDFRDTCGMWAFEYHKSIMYADLQGESAQAAVHRWCDTLQGITGDRTQEPGAVRIGGDRNGMAVAVEADETILDKSKRTRMRATGRPKDRWLLGAVEEQ